MNTHRYGDMVLCRNTFPVVALSIKLLSEGKKSYIIGSDIGMSLISMILSPLIVRFKNLKARLSFIRSCSIEQGTVVHKNDIEVSKSDLPRFITYNSFATTE